VVVVLVDYLQDLLVLLLALSYLLLLVLVALVYRMEPHQLMAATQF
jgi:hypothetical protein